VSEKLTTIIVILSWILDISWQTALAHSAVSAAEDVRSTVRAARTAGNAKFAASSAFNIAQSVCDKGKFGNIEEARAAQTRASIAQSHAIHAAVVEHESKTVKRRATLALAHDVKCWNVHRKREVLQVCLAHAKSQHEATRREVDAWSCLRDGFIGSTIIPSTQTWRSTKVSKPKVEPLNEVPEVEPTTTIFGSIDNNDEGKCTIVAVEHEQLRLPKEASTTSVSNGDNWPDAALSMMVTLPIPEEVDDVSNSDDKECSTIDSEQFQPLQSELSDSGSDHVQSETDLFIQSTTVAQSSLFSSSEKELSGESASEKENHEALTSSMQSLVDGLMNWGGIDVEDTFALPTGMAASIALEESIAFRNKPWKKTTRSIIAMLFRQYFLENYELLK
jgi:hypothetical protein